MTFTDGNPFATAGDFSIKTLNWGGTLVGTAPTVSIVSDPTYSGPGSGWKVMADTVTYAEKGTDTVSLTVKDSDGSTASTANTSFSVADAPLTDTTPASKLNAVEGHTTGTVVLATFSDANPSAPLADFTAKVNWGGTLIGTPPSFSVQLVSRTATASNWEVVGNAIYSDAGLFTVTVTVSDADGSSMQTSNTKISVADAALTDTTATKTVNATVGKSTGSVVLATFTDANPYATAADYTITMNWNGASVLGTPTITLLLLSNTTAGETWAVVANVTFTQSGTYTPTVSIVDDDGSSLSSSKTTFDVKNTIAT